MTKWAVLGSGGMLGQELVNLLRDEDCASLDRSDCDISNFENLMDSLTGAEYVINCAGWTDVDAAESHEDEAHAANALGASNVAKACLELNAKLVHLSTDYVFDGDAREPYSENAKTRPKSAYGRTKLAGEEFIKQLYPSGSYIVRTAWLYGENGSNFVKTMADLESQKEFISVVCDQFGQPTWTVDLGKKLIELILSDANPGIYHGTSSGQTSWFGFAQKIFELLGADINRVKPIKSSEFIRPAMRPAYSVLSHDGWKATGIKPIRNWEQAIVDAFEEDCFT